MASFSASCSGFTSFGVPSWFSTGSGRRAGLCPLHSAHPPSNPSSLPSSCCLLPREALHAEASASMNERFTNLDDLLAHRRRNAMAADDLDLERHGRRAVALRWVLVHDALVGLRSAVRLLPFMPFKHNAARRHRIPRARYRVANWAAYEAGPAAARRPHAVAGRGGAGGLGGPEAEQSRRAAALLRAGHRTPSNSC